jgi:hypothetical protein
MQNGLIKKSDIDDIVRASIYVQAALAILGFGIRGFDYLRFTFSYQICYSQFFPLIIRGFSLEC